MTTLADVKTATISLAADCPGGAPCRSFAEQTHTQLSSPSYAAPCSLLELPPRVTDWLGEHRTARKRASGAARLGYRFSLFERADRADEIHEINISTDERQGRPMSDGYRTQPRFSPQPADACVHHRVYAYGVTDARGVLRAYTFIYRLGELALVSQILGHAAHLKDGIMYLLATGMIEAQIRFGGFVFYNRADSGTDGLRFYKERCGFEPTLIDWVLT